MKKQEVKDMLYKEAMDKYSKIYSGDELFAVCEAYVDGAMRECIE